MGSALRAICAAGFENPAGHRGGHSKAKTKLPQEVAPLVEPPAVLNPRPDCPGDSK